MPIAAEPTPDGLPVTWIQLSRDRGLLPFVQEHMRAHLGRPVDVVNLDAPHMVMLTHPHQLAIVLNRLAEP